MFEAADILGLYAETPLHPGSGATSGAVDLPVQRERHTDLPLIPGSSLKGVLREAAKAHDKSKVIEVFGPETRSVNDHGGAISITDARLLLFPVRSLEGIFLWVTCPFIIERLKRDLGFVGDQEHDLPGFPKKVFDGKQVDALVSTHCFLDTPLILEEVEYRASKDGHVDQLATFLPKLIPVSQFAPSAKKNSFFAQRLQTHLAVISDTDFTHIIRNCTEIVTRIKLNERKTTTGGGGNMWVEEYLPSDCLFYSLVLAMPSRKQNGGLDANGVLDFLRKDINPTVLQAGGDETVGRGWMWVQWLGTQPARAAQGVEES